MARDTGATVVVPLYPLAPQGQTAATDVPAMADLISSQIDQHEAKNVSVFVGDASTTFTRGAGVVYAPPESSSSTCRLPGSTPCSRSECRMAASSRSSATAFSRSRALLSVGHRFDDPPER